jgi:maltooligosyltrehalose trehalohydrolase
VKRRHSMPFGVECLDDGSVRFNLWAPAAKQVELALAQPNPSFLALQRTDNGWFKLTTDAARPGAEYSFRIDGGQTVPDPGSRFQPRDVHQPSEVIDPKTFDWRDEKWRGRPWQEAVIYELHVGTFTAAGTFAGVRERLDYLVELGVTAIELMPVSDFAGKRNWGYDGVMPFAPDSTYGRPDDLKELVVAAHLRGLMVFLDVVYNHFGPEGNYLGSYAPQFFTERHKTPWGNGINFDGPQSRVARDFFIHNALFWIHEYHFDGLRLDAVHAIADDSTPNILTEIADAVRASVDTDRQVHLILENDRNQARYLPWVKTVREHEKSNVGRSSKLASSKSPAETKSENCLPQAYTAQWNDDIHHALHVLLTGEKDGYYTDYISRPIDQLGRCLTEGFAYQGEASAHRNGKLRGETSKSLPPGAFISFLQNHDQVGNRAFGDRITGVADPRAVRAAMAILLLAPAPPMLFMGEEFAADTPFLFFCDFEKDLAAAVTRGRRDEFAHFAAFNNLAARERIPDPNLFATFAASRLNWDSLKSRDHDSWLRFYRGLLKLRREKIVPLLSGCSVPAKYDVVERRGLIARYHPGGGKKLLLAANMGDEKVSGFDFAASLPPVSLIPSIYQTENVTSASLQLGELPPWSVVWFLQA